jgi:hypothetical protein
MKTKTLATPRTLRKSRTGIRGLDEITGGGLPAGRPTLVCGGAGCGKTLLASRHNHPCCFSVATAFGPYSASRVANFRFRPSAVALLANSFRHAALLRSPHPISKNVAAASVVALTQKNS